MIIWIFILWLTLALTLLFLGFWADDQIIQTIAFGILWVPAFALSGINAPLINDNPGIQYLHGYNETTTYTYTNETLIDAENSIHSPNVVTYQNRLYGILLLFASVFGMILSVGAMRGVNDYAGPSRINWRSFWK